MSNNQSFFCAGSNLGTSNSLSFPYCENKLTKFEKHMKQIYVLLCLTLAFSSAFAQEKASPEQQAAYRKVITERAGKIASSLAITDAAKQERVTNIIRDQYNDLNEIYIVRDANLKALKLKYADDKTSLEAEKGKEAEKTDAKLAKLHKKYLDKLSGQLTEAQVEQVKNGMTYNVLPITYKAYQEQILTLTEEQKKQILVWLTEAREHAIDAESSEKKHGWFGKYKGRINNYLSAAGYDLKKEGAAWEQRRKAAEKKD
jgi:hypothetical protein